ncbi:hypothetical protein YW7DRAFT_05642 [Streptomyces sp. AmelKG-E11A]|nr:hypothetical protein YW7DRAFT_05642 [Streptomyces sp. AmelKG-E11A]
MMFTASPPRAVSLYFTFTASVESIMLLTWNFRAEVMPHPAARDCSGTLC